MQNQVQNRVVLAYSATEQGKNTTETEELQRTERMSPELVNGYRPEYAVVTRISNKTTDKFCHFYHIMFFLFVLKILANQSYFDCFV